MGVQENQAGRFPVVRKGRKFTQVTSESSSHLLHACQTPSLSSVHLTDLKPQARLQEAARGSAILGPLWPMRSPAWQRQVKGLGQGQDAGLNGEGAMCRPQGEMGAEPRCWAAERHRANTEGGGPEGADGGSEPSSLE